MGFFFQSMCSYLDHLLPCISTSQGSQEGRRQSRKQSQEGSWGEMAQAAVNTQEGEMV